MPAIALNAPITGASIVKLEFFGPSVVYDLQLSGHATFYDRVFSPSEPPTSNEHGIAVNPRALTLNCNVAVSSVDILLIHTAALEQWALDGQDCGAASLNLRAINGSPTIFAGRYALPATGQRYKVGHVRLLALGPDGKELRSLTLVAREGYGPVPFKVSLAGVARINLSWPDQRVIVFAMSLD